MATNDETVKLAECKKAFDKYDKDGSGSLQVGEVASLLKDLGLSLSFSQLRRKVAEFDADGNRHLDFEEFVAFKQNVELEINQEFTAANEHSYKAMKRTEYKKVFDKYDRDGNGTLQVGEVASVLKDLGFSMSFSQLRKKVAEFDTDASRHLDFEEFVAFIQKAEKEVNQTFVDKLSEEQLAEYKELFSKFDTDGSGELKFCDVAALGVELGLKRSECQDVLFMRKMVAQFDADGDAKVDFNEFAVMISRIKRGLEMTSTFNGVTREQRAEYQEEFDSHDKDGSGVLEIPELWSALEKKGVKMLQDEFQEILAEMDVLKSGKVQFSEFVYMIEKYTK